MKEDPIADVPFKSFIHSLLQIYGLQKMALRRRLIVNHSDCYSRITIEGRTVFWPAKSKLNRLTDMYFEVYKENSHRFDSNGTDLHFGDVVIDVGGCEGYFSLKALEKGAEKVFCFEPSRLIAKCLELTFAEERNSGRVEVINQFVGSTEGTVLFEEDPYDPTLGAISKSKGPIQEHCYPVAMTSIDTLCIRKELEKLNFIKIDVEGNEIQVLEGARKSIVKFSPKIAVATYHTPTHSRELKELIRSFDKDYRFGLDGLVDFDGIVRPVMLHCFKE